MKKIKILLGIAMVVSVLTIPVHGAEGDTAIPVISEIPQITPVETPVRELRVEGNKIFYYYKGKMVRNKWKRYEGYKYYFGEENPQNASLNAFQRSFADAFSTLDGTMHK